MSMPKQQSMVIDTGAVGVTLQSISASKLLNYVHKDELMIFLTPQRYMEVEAKLRQDLNKPRPNVRDVKKYLVTRSDFIDALRKHSVGAEAFKRYLLAVDRLRHIDKGRAVAVRQVMSAPLIDINSIVQC